jgi:hypothetical protein
MSLPQPLPLKQRVSTIKPGFKGLHEKEIGHLAADKSLYAMKSQKPQTLLRASAMHGH